MSAPPMEQVLLSLREAHALLSATLDELEKRRDSERETAAVVAMVGDLAAMLGRLERERARWVAL